MSEHNELRQCGERCPAQQITMSGGNFNRHSTQFRQGKNEFCRVDGVQLSRVEWGTFTQMIFLNTCAEWDRLESSLSQAVLAGVLSEQDFRVSTNSTGFNVKSGGRNRTHRYKRLKTGTASITTACNPFVTITFSKLPETASGPRWL